MTALVPLIGPMPDEAARRTAWQVATVRRLGELAARLAEDAALQAIADASAARTARAAEAAHKAEALARERNAHEAQQAKEKARAKAHWFQHVPKLPDGTAANPIPDYDALFPSLPPPAPVPYRTPKMAGSRAAQVFERMTRLAIHCFAVADRLAAPPQPNLAQPNLAQPNLAQPELTNTRRHRRRTTPVIDEEGPHPLVAELTDTPRRSGLDPPEIEADAVDPNYDPHAPDERHATYPPRPPGTPW